MRVVAIANQKGGPGKTTISLQMGIAAAGDRQRTLIIDLDPQGSGERWHALRVKATRSHDDPSIVAGPVQKLTDMLKAAARLGADLVIIDTPPKLDKAITEAAKVADIVLLPLRWGVLDGQALEDTVNLLKLANAHDKAAVVLNGLPCDDTRAAIVRECRSVARKLALPVLPAQLSQLPEYNTSLKKGRGVTETNQDGEAASEIRALLAAASGQGAKTRRKAK
ncbi:MAG: AAA family ATPase [Hyphomicrobiaceae bacterium]